MTLADLSQITEDVRRIKAWSTIVENAVIHAGLFGDNGRELRATLSHELPAIRDSMQRVGLLLEMEAQGEAPTLSA
jgi:hypothetical protein